MTRKPSTELLLEKLRKKVLEVNLELVRRAVVAYTFRWFRAVK